MINRNAVPAIHRMLFKNISRALLVLASSMLAFSAAYATVQPKTDDATESITALIHRYERSVSDADTKLAGEVWLQTNDVSFIYPLGHEHGWEEIKRDIYERLMGQTFSERQLTASDISVHAQKDAAWAEFNWVFVAKLRSNGSAVKTEGRETQVYFKTEDGWRLVHVHYSGLVVPPQSGGSPVKGSN
jgi:ketosteroid isomerase-like protein